LPRKVRHSWSRVAFFQLSQRSLTLSLPLHSSMYLLPFRVAVLLPQEQAGSLSPPVLVLLGASVAAFLIAVLSLLAYSALLPSRNYVRAGRTALNTELLQRVPALSEVFSPPFWAFNAYIQTLLYLFSEIAQLLLWRHFKRQVLVMPDGGSVALDWWSNSETRDLPAEAPVIIVQHHMVGSSRHHCWMARCAWRRHGFRVVCAVRRGHLGPLTSPRFNLLGSVEDLRLQVDAVRRRYPDAPLCMVGYSAGTATQLRYLGEEGAASPIVAATTTSFAYNSSPGYQGKPSAFERLNWLADLYVRSHVKSLFLRQNRALLQHIPGFHACLRAKRLSDIRDLCFRMEGCASMEELDAQNPQEVFSSIRIPLLSIQAADDPVCVIANVVDWAHVYDEPQDRILVLTNRGGHCAHFEGSWWPKALSFADRVALEYLHAVLDIRREQGAAVVSTPRAR
jgi:hypothetical protein